MYETIDGRLGTTIDGRFTEENVDTLSYMMEGAYFPQTKKAGSGHMYFESTEPQEVTLSYGDGTTDTYLMVEVDGNYRIGWHAEDSEISLLPNGSRKPRHLYEDSNTDSRTVSIKFEKPLSLITVFSDHIILYGSYPTEIGSFKNLDYFNITWARSISEVPVSIGKLKKLRGLVFQYNTIDKELKIPDVFFELTNLKKLTLDGSFDLRDPISSNLFKINQLTKLERLGLTACNIVTLPNEFYQLENLTDLRLSNNAFKVYPTQLKELKSISTLFIGFDPSMSTFLEWGDFVNYEKLGSFSPFYPYFNLQAIPEDWKYLYSLYRVAQGIYFKRFIATDARFDEFINAFYELITNEASITEGGSAEPYPNRFRDIAWGDTSLTFTGIYEAPSGYVQGSDNGNPVTQGQRVYVMIEQYGHTIKSTN